MDMSHRPDMASGKTGLAMLLLKNRSYFLGNDEFMEKICGSLHFRNLDDVRRTNALTGE
jgi:hypothetical protein